MDKYFKPFKTGLIDVEERYPCGRKAGNKTEARVFYRCKCVCGKEFILTGQELSKHPYSCGCTPKPESEGDSRHHSVARGDGNKTMVCMISPKRAVYSTSATGVSGVFYDAQRKKWRARIYFQGHGHHLGYWNTKEEAIAARVAGEKKFFDPYIDRFNADQKAKSQGKYDAQSGIIKVEKN
jgi:hypothetical protein